MTEAMGGSKETRRPRIMAEDVGGSTEKACGRMTGTMGGSEKAWIILKSIVVPFVIIPLTTDF
jgi:hypothetical protein